MPHGPSSSAHSSPAGSPPGSPGSYSSQERLILVPDDRFESDALLGLWPDEEEAPTPTTERSHSISSIPNTNAPALPPRAIIPLLIGPCIKLGTTYIPRAVEIAGPIPALVGLVGMALLSAFTGQVWVLLGRYVSRWTIEEIVAEAMIRNPGRRGSPKDKWKRRIRKGTRVLVCVTALLLCAMYLHESAHLLQPAIPLETSYASQAGTTVILAAVLMPLVSATSLATRKVLWSNFLSIILQLVIAIVGAVHYFHGEDEERHTHTRRGLSKLTESHTQAGTWEAISILSFAFANQLLTLPLYSALVTNFAAKPTFAPRSRTRRMITSFPVLLLVSTAASIALTLPLILAPLTRHAAPPNPSDIPTVLRAPIRETLSRTLEAAIPTIQAFALILTIPPLFAGVIVPRVRQRSYRWILFLLAAALAAVIPGRKASLTSLSMTLSLLTCYVLPAILHAVFHGLRRPRSILFSGPNPPLTSSEPATASSSSPDPEALLRHKERSLQRRRLARRVLWDVGVWVVLGPVGMAATVWTAGRAIGVW